ncbi:MAG: hypothetical protein WCL61_01990 [bacterium]
MKPFKREVTGPELSEENRIKEAVIKLREELKILTGLGTLVFELKEWINQGHLPLGESGDILIDAIPSQVDSVREYLGSEKEYILVKEGPGPRYATGGGYWFILNLNK